MKVLKFGGSSVANSENIQKVLAIVAEASQKDKIIVLVSAFGKTTDKLLAAANAALEDIKTSKSILENIKAVHHQIIEDLIVLNTEEVSEEMHDLMEELHVNDTSFFGVPDPIQNLWSEFYEEGQRNLLSLSSEEYFCLGTDDTGQVMYKKKRMEKLVFHFIGRIIKRTDK